MLNNQVKKKPKILCLHGHASSGKILKEEVKDWPERVLEKMDLVFLDGPFPVEDSSLIGRYDPPYYDWFKEDDQPGSLITAALQGMQREGVAFTKVPKVKFLILISGYMIGGNFDECPPLAENAFAVPIDIPALFMIGEKDQSKEKQFELLEAFVHPTLYYHHGGHGVPTTLDENGMKIVLEFLNMIQAVLLEKENMGCETSSLCCQCFGLVCSLLFAGKRKMAMKKARISNVA